MLILSETREAPQATTPDFGAIELLIALDADAWQSLYQRYFRKMYSYAFVRTGDADLAEEIAAEVFAAAIKGIRRYRPTGAPLAAWLYRIARNLTADQLERRRKYPSAPLETMVAEVASGATQIEDRADLARAIAGLTREQQEIIALRFFADCSVSEAAEALGKTTGTVKSLQHRALATLRRQMAARGRER